MKTLGGSIGALGLIALLIFAAVAIHELHYAGSHPFRYGPAKVIASAAGAGALVSAAVALCGVALTQIGASRRNRSPHSRRRQ